MNRFHQLPQTGMHRHRTLTHHALHGCRSRTWFRRKLKRFQLGRTLLTAKLILGNRIYGGSIASLSQLKWILYLLVFASCAINVGCVQRRLIVRSQPEGALVTIDNHTLGHTPVKVPFVYYGTRQIQLEKEGYQTIKVKERIRPPWYEKFPLSFFSNNLAFREIRDERMLDFTLVPRSQVEENLLLDRANDLRLNTQRETLTCPPSAPFQ
jgi:hypothetical protein